MLCPQCQKKINIKNAIYMSCDARVCSHNCSIKRARNIEKTDRYLQNPIFWDTGNTMDEEVGINIDNINLNKTSSELPLLDNNNNNIINRNNNEYVLDKVIIKIVILASIGLYVRKQYVHLSK